MQKNADAIDSRLFQVFRCLMSDESERYEYVLYIDEAGDDGLDRVRPEDPNGATEWLCIGGFLMRSKYEAEVVNWVREIRQDISATQGSSLHFRNLLPHKRAKVCKALAKLPGKAFVVCSHKANMKGHRNARAKTRGGRQWFYNYCVRLLMERVTEICYRDGLNRAGTAEYLRVVFSKRGGHSYAQTKAYWELLKRQAAGGTTLLNKREIRHQVLRFNLVHYVPHNQNAGLQLADIVASSFYQAADARGSKWDPQFAKLLKPIMAYENGSVADFGVALQPTNPREINLSGQQQSIFKYYGYQF